jgi:hypothetical protein
MTLYEKHHEPLIPFNVFLRRLARHASFAGLVVAGSLAIGILGYHLLEGLSWIDSLLNASMILGGMGPVDALHTNLSKVFASVYALYSGVAFLVVAGVMFTPVFHRLLHHFHLDSGNGKSGVKRP